MSTVAPTITDISRAVVRLDEHASTPAEGMAVIGRENWTREDLRISVAENLAFVIGSSVRMGRLTKRDVGLMLAAHGASPFTIEQHALAIAAMLRADLGSRRMGASV
jgi:hypothetical protein